MHAQRVDRQGGNVRVDKSFVDVRLSHLLDIKPAKLNTSYEVELADEKVLGTFDVIIGMDWLVERDAVIVCGKKEVHVPYKNKMLVVKGDSGASRLKVISCIKARKYIERGSQLFLAQVTEKEKFKDHRCKDLTCQAFTASSTISSIYIQQFWDTIRFDKDKGYCCQLDEQRFYLTKATLKDELQLPSDNINFTPPPNSNTIISLSITSAI
ncbi:hypothetical protein Tco_0573556 [Tanacetum coccineum]